MTVRIGTSGWSYDHWAGVLYPRDLPAHRRRDVYVRHFDTVELNASFYRWPAARTFGSWRNQLPDGFEMSVKASRGLTHAKRLHGPERWLERLRRDWHSLGPRRGVVLVQLHPGHERDDARLAWFLDHVPEWMRVAVELRHHSWHVEAVRDLLASRGAAYVVLSGAHLPCRLWATAPFVYVRLHGPSHDHLYAGSYSDDDLRWWRDRIGEWQAQGRDTYAYFNNDGDGNAVRNAWTLRGPLA
jgi:uncharacterized protein YecE (DUF72 family)